MDDINPTPTKILIPRHLSQDQLPAHEEQDLGHESSSIDTRPLDPLTMPPPKRGKGNNTGNKNNRHHPSCCHFPTQCEHYGPPTLLKPSQIHRLLYTNPVCLLTTILDAHASPNPQLDPHSNPSLRPNVMTITWLTPTDNNGNLFLSMNATRFSALNVLESKRFVLNIPISGMEDLIRRVGKCSGSTSYLANDSSNTSSNTSKLSKFQTLNIGTTCIGWKNFFTVEGEASEVRLTCGSTSSHTLPFGPVSMPGTPNPSQRHDGGIKSLDYVEHIDGIINRCYLGPKRFQNTPQPPPELAHQYQLWKDSQHTSQQGQSNQPQDLTLTQVKAFTQLSLDQHRVKSENDELSGLRGELEQSLRFGDVILSDCVAHIVCEVVGWVSPLTPTHSGSPLVVATACSNDAQSIGNIGTPGHYSLFCRAKLGFVRRKYWNQGLFQPAIISTTTSTTLANSGNTLNNNTITVDDVIPPTITERQQLTVPPYLTFLGDGKFLKCVRD